MHWPSDTEMWTQEGLYGRETLATAAVICNLTLKWKSEHRFVVTSSGIFDEVMTFWMAHRRNVCQRAEWMSRQMDEYVTGFM